MKHVVVFSVLRRCLYYVVCCGCWGWLAFTGSAWAAETIIVDEERFPVVATLDFNRPDAGRPKGKYYWLDNERIIFTAMNRHAKPALSAYLKKYVTATGYMGTVAVWNTQNNQANLYMPGSVQCVNPLDGTVQIDTTLDKGLGKTPRHYLQGVWGNNGENLQPYAFYFPSQNLEKSGNLNPFSCRYFAKADLNLHPEYSATMDVHEQHGFFYWQKGARSYDPKVVNTMYFYDVVSNKDTPIEYRIWGILLDETLYIPWQNTYLLQGMMTLSDIHEPKTPRPVRLLKLDGTIETIDPPAILWEQVADLKGGMSALASKAGMLWRFSEKRFGNRLGLEGIYLQEGTQLTRIVPWPSPWAISPNGCRLAVERNQALAVIQLCKE